MIPCEKLEAGPVLTLKRVVATRTLQTFFWGWNKIMWIFGAKRQPSTTDPLRLTEMHMVVVCTCKMKKGWKRFILNTEIFELNIFIDLIAKYSFLQKMLCNKRPHIRKNMSKHIFFMLVSEQREMEVAKGCYLWRLITCCKLYVYLCVNHQLNPQTFLPHLAHSAVYTQSAPSFPTLSQPFFSILHMRAQPSIIWCVASIFLFHKNWSRCLLSPWMLMLLLKWREHQVWRCAPTVLPWG